VILTRAGKRGNTLQALVNFSVFQKVEQRRSNWRGDGGVVRKRGGGFLLCEEKIGIITDSSGSCHVFGCGENEG